MASCCMRLKKIIETKKIIIKKIFGMYYICTYTKNIQQNVKK